MASGIRSQTRRSQTTLAGDFPDGLHASTSARVTPLHPPGNSEVSRRHPRGHEGRAGHRRRREPRVSPPAGLAAAPTARRSGRPVRAPCLLIRPADVNCRSRSIALGGERGRVGIWCCARAPGLTLVRDPRVGSGAGDEMFDGVIPLGEALRPLDLSRPSTRVACRQQGCWSRPRRIGVSEGLTRANGRWKVVVVVGSSGMAGARCHTAQPEPGSSGESIRGLLGCRRLGAAGAAA